MSLWSHRLKASILPAAFLIAGFANYSIAEADEITAIMEKPRYVNAKSQWSLVVVDAETDEIINSINPDALSFTGSVRKLFSVGMALNKLGPDKRFETIVYKNGRINAHGTLKGNLILKAAGDLTFGGRRKANGALDFNQFDHNEARSFDGAILTPEDPLTALNDLASQISAAGIKKVDGNVIIDDRLFDSFRVPNGDALISPMLINENVIDVSLFPNSTIGQPGILDWRPKTSGYTIQGTSITTSSESESDIRLSGETFNDSHLNCIGKINCNGFISSTKNLTAPALIPFNYKAPFVDNTTFVNTLRIDDPASFARIAFIDALKRAGIEVTAPSIAMNATNQLPATSSYSPSNQIASFISPPYSEVARLILKVSLNTGANLSLMQLGISQGKHTRDDALEVEREILINEIGLDPTSFNFPTNGSGSPDSRASTRATATLLSKMSHHANYSIYRAALPVLGTDGSMTDIGKSIIGKKHISVKSGTTITNGKMLAMSNAGYMDAKSGRRLAFALFVNNAGPLTSLDDALQVFEDEAQILGIIYAMN